MAESSSGELNNNASIGLIFLNEAGCTFFPFHFFYISSTLHMLFDLFRLFSKFNLFKLKFLLYKYSKSAILLSLEQLSYLSQSCFCLSYQQFYCLDSKYGYKYPPIAQLFFSSHIVCLNSFNLFFCFVLYLKKNGGEI